MIRASLPYAVLSVLVAVCAPAVGCSDTAEDGDNADVPSQNRDVGDNNAVPDDNVSDNTDDGNDGDRPDENSGEDWDWDSEDFEIRSVIPDRGPLDGGTRVEIDGHQLTDNIQVWFGSRQAEVELSQGRLIVETPPAHDPGPVSVRAITPDGEQSQLDNGFTYADAVTIDELLPSAIPTTGAMGVELHGAGFGEPMGVSFSGVSARSIEVVDDNLARVDIPPLPAGDTDVRVTSPHDSDVAEDLLHVFEPLDVDTIEPAVGDVDGGENVVITAAGLTVDTAVYFDGTPADVVSTSLADGELTVQTPPAAGAGPVDVMLVGDYDSLVIEDGFFYDDATESLRSIQPSTTSLDGGEHIVSGRGLDAWDAELIIGDQQATIIDAYPTHAVIDVPAAAEPGSVDVVFERSDTEISRLDDGLEYLPDLDIDEVTPAAGDADGGDTVTITGVGLDQVQRVTFGGVSAPFTTSGDELTVTTEAAEPGTVDVAVDDGHRRVIAEDAFTFEAEPEIWSMSPPRGAVAGNTHVTLQGRGFTADSTVDIDGESGVDVQRLDPYTVTFRTPPSSSTGPHDVAVVSDGQSATAPYPFVYFNPGSSFGGAWGPPVDGAINVTVINIDGSPVPGAFVMLSNGPDTPHQGYADDAGQITFSGPGVIGPQTITATAAEMSTFTVRELDARNVTLILNPVDPEQGDPGEIPPAPMAHVEGTVSVKGKIPSADGGMNINMSRVRTTTNTIGAWSMPPGDDATVAGEGDYEIRTGVGDMALVALCGYYDADDDHFTPKLMAVQRNVSLANGDRLDIDLDCDIALDNSVPIRILDPVYAPDGPTGNEVTPYIDFGYEGVFEMPQTVSGLGDILVVDGLPAAEGPLANISYAATAGSYNNGGMPFTEVTMRDIPPVDQLFNTDPLVAVPELLEPVPGGVIDDQIWLGHKGSNAPDFIYLRLTNFMGMPVWSFIIPGDDKLIPMPEFPSFSDLDADSRPNPYGHDEVYGLIYAPRINGFDYNAFTWYDLRRSQWSAFAVDAWNINLQ